MELSPEVVAVRERCAAVVDRELCRLRGRLTETERAATEDVLRTVVHRLVLDRVAVRPLAARHLLVLADLAAGETGPATMTAPVNGGTCADSASSSGP